MIKVASPEHANRIVNTKKPIGKFITKNDGKYVAIDNSDGQAFVKEADTLDECKSWLNGKELVI